VMVPIDSLLDLTQFLAKEQASQNFHDAALARAAGITNVAYIRHGKRGPTLLVIIKLLKALGFRLTITRIQDL